MSAFQMEARARRVVIVVALERVKRGRRHRGQWFWVVVERFVRQSGQMRCVQGRILGGVSEDQQTMQVASSSVGEEAVLSSLGDGSEVVCSVTPGWLASGMLLMNLSKLGRLPQAFD